MIWSLCSQLQLHFPITVISFVTNIFLHHLLYSSAINTSSSLFSFLIFLRLIYSLLCSLPFFDLHSPFSSSSSSPSPLHLPIILHHSFLHLHPYLLLLLLLPHYAVYRYLSMRQAGKGVILEVASQDLKKKIEKILKAEQAARTSVSTYRLISYCSLWYRMLGDEFFPSVPLQLLCVVIVMYWLWVTGRQPQEQQIT